MGLSKYDNAFKQKALLKGIDKQVAEIKRLYYKKQVIYHFADFNGEMIPLLSCDAFNDMYEPYRKGYNLIDCAVRLNESKRRRSSRVRQKISDLVLHKNAIFVTLTFSDLSLQKFDTAKRRRLVQRFLKDNCSQYVANIDYGSDDVYIDDYGVQRVGTNREHYHAVVSNDIVFNAWYKYGAIKVERVRPCEDSNKRLSRYITKLTNHALKIGALAPRLIYSRNTL